MASKDSVKKTLTVAIVLCVICSVIVSTAAVVLRPTQKANKANDIRQSILAAAGMLEKGKPLDEQFKQVDARLIDIETGKFTDAVDIATYDQLKAAKNPKLSEPLPDEQDVASINRLEKYAKVYLVDKGQGLEKVVLPIRGYGLWSTLKGFIALKSDMSTVVGIGYYDHKETPGLGGEVDNPKWKSNWIGKEIYDDKGNVVLDVVKGSVDASSPNAEHKIDGLSGATLTSDGVENMIQFWFGKNGYGPFLDKLKKGEA